MKNPVAEKLLDFMKNSPTRYQVVANFEQRLNDAGYTKLYPEKVWQLENGGKYYLSPNGTAIMAFRIPDKVSGGFMMAAAHSDSPTFKVKDNAEKASAHYVQLSTERYGGALMATWFDRPLSIAGRVILRGADALHPVSRVLHIERPLLQISHLAIHFNRGVNEGNPLSKQNDMLPVLGFLKEELEHNGLLLRIVAEELGVDQQEILDFDLYLYDTTPACLVGWHEEFIQSGRLDDLSMVHAGLTALLQAEGAEATQVLGVFDNEETGSGTKQGAHSPVLRHVLERVALSDGSDREGFYRALEQSFLVSADNAHGLHPNYVSKQDPTNHPLLGGGPVIKYNANQKYATDAESAAVFAEVCREAGVPCQYFVNHSDVAGGSTLGNILTAQLPLRGVDMGNAIWAMHSVRETGAAIDQDYTTRAFTTFYQLP